MSERNGKNTIPLSIVYIIGVLGLAFLAPLMGGSPSNIGVGFILWGIAPTLIAMIMRIATKDWADAGLKPNFKKNAVQYIVAVFAFPVMTLLSFLISGWASVSTFAGFSMEKFLNAFIPALPLFFVFSVFEEFGWRGYLVPKLASSGLNPVLMNVIVAIIWAFWHIPYFRELSWVYTSEDLWSFIPRFFIAMFAFAILYSEVTLMAKSVWPAVIMHCLMNSFGHPLAADFLRIVPGKEYLASSTGFVMIILSAAMGIGLYIWRTRHQRPAYANAETRTH